MRVVREVCNYYRFADIGDKTCLKNRFIIHSNKRKYIDAKTTAN